MRLSTNDAKPEKSTIGRPSSHGENFSRNMGRTHPIWNASRSLILPGTLRRIKDNLNKERRSREWLKDAQSYARARLRGVIQISGIDVPSKSTSLVPDNKRLQALGIEPLLYLRPSIRGSWQVVLDIPDLAPVCSRFPGMTEILRQSRCVVAGSNEAPLARGRLLSRGSQLAVLRKWPRADEVLLKFERSSLAILNSSIRCN
jgi:hypothetical protein